MTISIYAEKVYDKIQYYFLMKTHNKRGIEGNFLNMIKANYWKPTANITINDEKLKAFRNKISMPAFATSFNIVLEVLAREISQKKKKKN